MKLNFLLTTLSAITLSLCLIACTAETEYSVETTTESDAGSAVDAAAKKVEGAADAVEGKVEEAAHDHDGDDHEH